MTLYYRIMLKTGQSGENMSNNYEVQLSLIKQECVTFLFLQKERDLELAARIGQSLLKKNKTLSERNEFLEEQVEHIREEVRDRRITVHFSPLQISFSFLNMKCRNKIWQTIHTDTTF